MKQKSEFLATKADVGLDKLVLLTFQTVDKLTGLVSSMKQKSEFLATKADVGLDKLVEDIGDIGSLQQRLTATLGSNDGNLPQVRILYVKCCSSII